MEYTNIIVSKTNSLQKNKKNKFKDIFYF